MKYIKKINEGFEDDFNSKWYNHLFLKHKDEYSELYIIYHDENSNEDNPKDTWIEYIGKKSNKWYLLTGDFDRQDAPYDSYEELSSIHGTPTMEILKKFDIKKFSTFKEIEKLFNIEKKEIEENFEDYFADLIDNGFTLINKEVMFLSQYNEIVKRGSLDDEQIVKFTFRPIKIDKNKIFSKENNHYDYFNDIDTHDKIYPVLKKINKVLNTLGKKLYYSTSNNLIVIIKNL